MADLTRRNFFSMAAAAAGAFMVPLVATSIKFNWLDEVDTKAWAEQIVAELKAEFKPAPAPHVGPKITRVMPEGQHWPAEFG